MSYIRTYTTLVSLLLSLLIYAIEPQVWPLWPKGIPSDNELQGQEENYEWGSRRVCEPTLIVYPAAEPNGQAVLVCPGGAYEVVCHKHEGTDMAEWFNRQGITLAVLRYRMPNGHATIPLEDGQQAMRMLRAHTDDLHIRQVGVMGFSAGGHLATTIATHFVDAATRPDFQIPVYPVVSMDSTITHMGSRLALLGRQPSDEQVLYYSNEQQVNATTPPAFIVLSGDDDVVPIANSLRYYEALQRNHVAAELHMYPAGGHGWGYNDTPYRALWTEKLAQWLHAQSDYRNMQNIRYTLSADSYAQSRCKLDVHYPTDTTDVPVVVWFHGGGLEFGEKHIDPALQQAGYTVFAVNYRLLPHVAVDSILDDAAAAVAWVYRHAEQYNGSHRKIFLAGHSAGGYLVSMISLNKQYLVRYGIDADSIAGVFPFSGQAITHYAVRRTRGITPYQPTIDQYAPLTFIRPDAPPMVIISGDRELELFGRYEEQAYLWRMLKLVGHKEVYLYEMQGYDHGAMPYPAYPIMKKHIDAIVHRK